MFCLFIIVLIAIFGGVQPLDKDLVVTTKQGQIEGSLSENKLYYEFLGIRYAVPIRFRAPSEPPSFPGIYKADVRTVICPQFPTNDPLAAPSDSEDCLVLNVFTPTNFANTTLPVLVYLHGGDFGIGSGSPAFYGPQYLVSHGVVLITVNYRLNAYGFLNLGLKDAPGNAGLKDIRAALRWVKDNVKSFGGDPDNVTLFGQGSGGVAALYMTLSQTTKGLFKRIISQSGSMFTPESFDASPLKTAGQVVKTLGVNTLDAEELYKVFNETPVRLVEEAISKQMHPRSVFLPTVEEEFEGEEAFLTESPYKILIGDKDNIQSVPIMVGMTTVEGLTSTLDYYTVTSQIDRIRHEDFSAIDPRNFDIPSEEIDSVRNLLKDTYFANGTVSDEMVLGGIINMNSDFSFVGPMSLFTELYFNKTEQPIYDYVFDYVGNRNLGRLLTNSSLPATTNSDELFYLFELERLPLPMDENDARMVTFMTMMWTNFAKYGNPTPDSANGEWLPYPLHLAILLEPQYVQPLTPDRAYFWRTMFSKYGNQI